jgi:glycosidase
MSLHRSFVDSALTGLLNFPITEHLKYIFSEEGNMTDLQMLLKEQDSLAHPDPHLLGNFVDNHDGERFLHNHSGSTTDLMNGLAWTMLYHGLPIVYYGTEQPEVSNQADERTSMWPAHFGATTLSDHITQLNGLRKQYDLAFGGADATTEAVVVQSSKHHLAFVRGKLLVLVANAGAELHERTCIEPSQLPGLWSDMCTSEHFVQVLGLNPSLKVCEDGMACLSTDNGLPVVYALEPNLVV